MMDPAPATCEFIASFEPKADRDIEEEVNLENAVNGRRSGSKKSKKPTKMKDEMKAQEALEAAKFRAGKISNNVQNDDHLHNNNNRLRNYFISVSY